jgi:hypothetical protein
MVYLDSLCGVFLGTICLKTKDFEELLKMQSGVQKRKPRISCLICLILFRMPLEAT